MYRPMTDVTGRAYLLMNIVEDNDKESLSLLSQTVILKRIVRVDRAIQRKGSACK